MNKLNLALIYGGISSEREVSLASGKQVEAALDKAKYHVTTYDPKTDIGRLVSDAPGIDAALVILHGPYGEDGTIQGLLELLGIPYQGSSVLGSAACMNKLAAKRLYMQAGLLVPGFVVLEKQSPVSLTEMAETIGYPLVIKPVSGGSSIGMSIVRSELTLRDAVDKGFEQDRELFMEAYIAGVEITGGVLGNRQLEALPLIEIIPEKGFEFFNYEAKYTPGATREICPARLDPETTARAQQTAVKAHRAMFCKGYSRTDMILAPDGRIFVLETNTIPGMTPTSLFPQAAKAAGYSFGRMMDRLIELAIDDHQQKKRLP
jgi:D-alanine-D-alanine ligase